ncbi:hypothetical protein [Kitasatospora purpeofusca]
MGWLWDSPEIEVEGVVSDYVVYDVAAPRVRGGQPFPDLGMLGDD